MVPDTVPICSIETSANMVEVMGRKSRARLSFKEETNFTKEAQGRKKHAKDRPKAKAKMRSHAKAQRREVRQNALTFVSSFAPLRLCVNLIPPLHS